jgi:uncharacterized membrane protein YgdD (TMEM256/DUF423 family)
MKGKWFFIGSVFGFLAVGIGAFGAHGLKTILHDETVKIFETGNKYHFYHTLVLLWIGTMLTRKEISKPQEKFLNLAGIFFAFGIVIFSGSLYALSTTGIRILGAITPIGGFSFLVGWTILAWMGYRHFQDRQS